MDLDELERLRAVAEQQLGTRELGSTYLYETDVDAYMTALRNSAEELIRDARRYRWLRNEAWGSIGAAPAVCMVDSRGRPYVDDERGADPILEGRELDANIDAAIAQERKE